MSCRILGAVAMAVEKPVPAPRNIPVLTDHIASLEQQYRKMQ